MITHKFTKTNEVDIEVNGIRYNSKRDFGLAIGNTDYLKEPIEDESNLVFVPGLPRPLDMSDDVFGETVYKYREIEIEFGGIRRPEDWDDMISNFRNLFEGRNVKIWFKTDPEWYWIGKARVEEFVHRRALGEFTFRVPYADAYKHREQNLQIQTTASGTKVLLENTRQAVMPVITTDAAITIQVGTNTISLTAGTWENTALLLKMGQTEWMIRGAANVTINYIEGSL